jgi:hypothetical protein
MASENRENQDSVTGNCSIISQIDCIARVSHRAGRSGPESGEQCMAARQKSI